MYSYRCPYFTWPPRDSGCDITFNQAIHSLAYTGRARSTVLFDQHFTFQRQLVSFVTDMTVTKPPCCRKVESSHCSSGSRLCHSERTHLSLPQVMANAGILSLDRTGLEVSIVKVITCKYAEQVQVKCLSMPPSSVNSSSSCSFPGSESERR